MVQYDPQVLVQHAERLYREANFTMLRYGLLGFLLGAVAGGTGGAIVGSAAGDAGLLFVAIGLATLVPLCTVVALVMGRDRAFALKMQAQTALCQVQIEVNTRAPVR